MTRTDVSLKDKNEWLYDLKCDNFDIYGESKQ